MTTLTGQGALPEEGTEEDLRRKEDMEKRDQRLKALQKNV